MKDGINNITDEEARLLVKIFKEGSEIFDQENKGKGKVIFIEGGICTVKFENGDIEKYKHPFFNLKNN